MALINKYTSYSDKYKVIERISRGSYGDVMLAIDVKTKEKYQLLLFYKWTFVILKQNYVFVTYEK